MVPLYLLYWLPWVLWESHKWIRRSQLVGGSGGNFQYLRVRDLFSTSLLPVNCSFCEYLNLLKKHKLTNKNPTQKQQDCFMLASLCKFPGALPLGVDAHQMKKAKRSYQPLLCHCNILQESTILGDRDNDQLWHHAMELSNYLERGW